MTCPFDFLTDFEGWFHYERCIHVDKLTPEQARTNVKAERAGWVLLDGMKTGGWRFPNAYGKHSTNERETCPDAAKLREQTKDIPRVTSDQEGWEYDDGLDQAIEALKTEYLSRSDAWMKVATGWLGWLRCSLIEGGRVDGLWEALEIANRVRHEQREQRET